MSAAVVTVVVAYIEGNELLERRWHYDAEWHAQAFRGAHVVAGLLAVARA